MSDPSAHDPAHDLGHAPEPHELTNPLMWTVGLAAIAAFLVWLFFHCMSVGAAEVRGDIPYSATVKQSGPPVDLPKLVAGCATPEMVAKGKQVFESNCASCHGTNGDTKGATTPNARNFHTDAFKNPNGGGPYALYLVVSNGFNGAMPGFVGLAPESRMAAVAYIREDFTKKFNPANYVAADPPELAKTIPAPGAEDSGGPVIPPNERPIPATVAALEEDAAERAEGVDDQMSTWAAALAGAAGADVSGDCERLGRLAQASPAFAGQLRQSAKDGDEKGFIALLTGEEAPGACNADFAVLPGERLEALYAAARHAAGGSP